MIKKLLFGQYVYKNSIIHFLDCRLKIIYTIILSILIFTIKNIYEILLFTVLIFIVIMLTKIDFKRYIKNLRPFYLIFIFIFLMYFLFTRNNLNQGLITIWRFFMLISISMILTFSTTMSSLVTGIGKLAKPLKIFGVKPRNIAVMISIAIRFVPLMFVVMEKTKEAMLSRLANFRKLKYVKLFILLLLEKMLKSASNLSDAMQSRLYNEDIESHKILRLSKYDYISIIFILIFILIIY